MRISLVLVPLLLGHVLTAQQTSTPCTLRGRTVNAITNEPIRRAELKLRSSSAHTQTMIGRASSPSGYTTTSDSEGNFSFVNIDPGTYYLDGQRAGFLNTMYGRGATNSLSSRAATQIRVTAGQEETGIVLRMIPQAVISGTVLDDEGEPVQNVSIQMLMYRYFRGTKRLLPVGSQSTNDRGEFRISGVAPGTYFLQATNMRMGMQDTLRSPGDTIPTALVSTYYPNAPDVASAGRITVSPGQDVAGLTIRMQRARVFRVRGTVIDGSTGQPVQSVSVSLMAGEAGFPRMMPMSRHREDSSFELSDVPSGTYKLQVTTVIREGNTMRTAPGSSYQVTLQVGDHDIEGLHIVIPPKQNISGTIKVEGDGKLDLSRARVMLSASEGISYNTPAAGATANGTFTIEGVMPGKYFITAANLPDGAYVKQIRSGGTEDLTNQTADWTNAVPARLEITLSTRAAQLAGSVQIDGKPTEGAAIILMPQDGARDPYNGARIVSTNTAGQFQLRNLTPGEYRIYAFEDIDTSQIYDPDYWRPYETKGDKLSLAEGDNKTVTLKLIPKD